MLGRDFVNATKRLTVMSPSDLAFNWRMPPPPPPIVIRDQPLDLSVRRRHRSRHHRAKSAGRTDGARRPRAEEMDWEADNWEPPVKVGREERRPDTPRPRIRVDTEGHIFRMPPHPRGRAQKRADRIAKWRWSQEGRRPGRRDKDE
jgi:hypothetical protein